MKKWFEYLMTLTMWSTIGCLLGLVNLVAGYILGYFYVTRKKEKEEE